MTEDDDADLTAAIAAAARRRGVDPANYQVESQALDRASRRIHASEIRNLFKVPNDPRADFRAYDALPARSRVVLSELPINASAAKYADLLVRMRDEAALIEAVRDVLPMVVRDWIVDHYGRGHPRLTRL